MDCSSQALQRPFAVHCSSGAHDALYSTTAWVWLSKQAGLQLICKLLHKHLQATTQALRSLPAYRVGSPPLRPNTGYS
jgi:hypothetical protein